MSDRTRHRLKAAMNDDLTALARLVRRPSYLRQLVEDRKELLGYLRRPTRRLLWNSIKTTMMLPCPHREIEVLRFVDRVLSLPADLPGHIVEAGCYKGGSTSKISLACQRVGRELIVFDSFEGLPPSDETEVQTLYGSTRNFSAGSYRGGLEEVTQNVARFGAQEVCTYVKGWFDETMPGFESPIAAAFLDVDLSTSTRTCLEYLWPNLSVGGYLYTHDGHLPPVLEVLQNREFWNDVLGQDPPEFAGLGETKVIWAQKSLRGKPQGGSLESDAQT